jgi:hypothetical protein
VLVHPDQNIRLAVEMCDHGFARGTLRKIFQKCRGDVHVLEAAAGLRLLSHSFLKFGNLIAANVSVLTIVLAESTVIA